MTMAKSELIQIRVSEDTKEKLKRIAEAKGMSISEFLTTAELAYDSTGLQPKKILISAYHVKGTLNVSFTLEALDGEIVAVARFYKETVEIKGLCVIVGRTIEEIVKLTNSFYAVPLIQNFVENASNENILKECLEEEQ